MTTPDRTHERQLLQQTEKILLHPIHPHLISYCPTMDLIAVVTDEENLDVYRINGQRAFGLKRKSEDTSVDALQWEFNGKSIAVSWSDGSTDLVSAETGKMTHKDVMLPEVSRDGDKMLEEEAPARVKCMGWGLNFIDVEAVKKRTGLKTNSATASKTDAFGNPTTEDWDAFKDDTTLEDFLQRQPDFQTLDIAPDLPDQLAMMDMEALLPKLPAIPPAPALPFMRVLQADSGTFSSQAEVDALLHSHHLKDHNSVDMFIRCSDRGTIHPSIYDSLETVSVQLPRAWNMTSTPLLHTSHPYSCTHGLLMQTTRTDKRHIAFVPLTLNFIPSAGIYLHLIAAKTSQLQNLLLYLTQTLQRIRAFFKHAQDLPRKFMLNISETLADKGLGDLVTNLYHIACTGNCSPAMKEWLTDELTEAGHKRWDTTVSTSYTTLIALVHENLIPALDRCSLVLSRLRGLSAMHDQDWIFSGPQSDFSALLDALRKMRLLAHTALLYAAEEKRQFGCFSRWLRFMIDYQATELESQSRLEMENRDPGVDVGLVLQYIECGLTKSDLIPFFRLEGQLGGVGERGEVVSYDETRRAVEVGREGGGYREDALCLERVLGQLGEGVRALLRQVSGWQESNILMGGGVVLEESSAADEMGIVGDMRMVVEPSPAPSDDISTYILLAPPSSPPGSIHIHRLTHKPSITHLNKDIHTYAITTLDFNHHPSSSSNTGKNTTPESKILDAKFADNTNILILLQTPQPNTNNSANPAKNTILSLPYTQPAGPIIYTPLPLPTSTSTRLPDGTPAPASSRHHIHITREMVAKYTRHVFEGRFTPLRLVVNGRKGRRVIVVLGSDRKHYRVLDMDFASKMKKGEGKGKDKGGGGGGEESSSDGSDGELDREGDVEMRGA
ncbi:hypothetical protein BDW02DRAFT_543989 [Decorospora gaudefroyi]|uniref:Anaphase-promoting complex subunit 4 n=1 Tax=Decorospora gaudefroyi TaxID=184978 RepID=A0A6A5KNE4_9PLEO|nr:hypothetical protein BDW02DRAFT_543989 [Decorospora gaudefroyi]